MTRVLIADELSANAEAVFRQNGIEVDVKVGMSPDELIACIGDYDGLAVRSATKVTAAVLDAAAKLKIVGRAGIGVDNIDVPLATQRGVVVMNTPFGNATTTAEHAVGMMFALARQITAANASTQAGKWEKSRFMGVELTGKTLGLIGCGNIGSIVADRAHGLHMRVVAYDPYLSPERAIDLGIEKLELDDLLARADFITLHAPLTDSTRGIIDAGALAKTRQGVYIINCARGGLVVEEDLAAALDSGHVAGAGFDVFVKEPAKENILFGRDNVVCTPHLGAATNEAQENVAVQVAEQMSDFLLTGAVTNAINMPSVTADEAPRLRPYMALAEHLGSFAGQLTETGISAVTVEFQGHVATLNTRPLMAAALTGLLRPMLDAVNMVSAPSIARERNIRVTESKDEQAGDYETMIRITVTTERQERSVTGTLFGGTRARIVNIKGIDIEAEMSPYMLYITNKDTPGVIGNLGRTLGDAGVNIATFHLGRAGQGNDAIALLQIDQPLDASVVDAVCKLPNIFQVKQLAF
ncbi:MAG: phosphoglycerate dehydrogenase [Proteobacteria bacterium]|jgi:D-3-phosphoglycerate dehydrogenase / 2-oxoglutarate reductase|nr:phosphoglycerate dehydrogenase [Pseudomonadota bacterium]